jgi:fructose-1,6-bisphosphatase/inositol monophosphatase family enzyme
MTQQGIRNVGSLPLGAFHSRFLRMVRETAAGVRRKIENGDVDILRKTSYAGKQGDDVVTSVDTWAQERLASLADELLPEQVGWIGEEDNLRKASTFRDHSIVVTFDPADGTRTLVAAIEAGRSIVPGEVSVMLGVQVDGEAVAGYICDVANLVVYYRKMYWPLVMQVRCRGLSTNMRSLPRARSLDMGTLLLHSKREPASPLTRRLIDKAFGHVQRGGASIGLSVARVFSGHFVALLRMAGTFSTPWDDTPLQAMCSQGDVRMLRVDRKTLKEVRFDQLDRIVQRDYDILYVHSQYLDDLRRYARIVTL